MAVANTCVLILQPQQPMEGGCTGSLRVARPPAEGWEDSVGRSWWCYSDFPFLLSHSLQPNLFLHGVLLAAQDCKLLHLAWRVNTALASRRHQESSVENKTLKAQSLYTVSSEALLLMSTHWTGSGFSFLLPRSGRIFLQVCMSLYLFSSSSQLFYPTRARLQNPYARGK